MLAPGGCPENRRDTGRRGIAATGRCICGQGQRGHLDRVRAIRIRPLLSSTPALQDILEKCVRELGAIRLIDSRVGVPGQLACNPRVILGRFTTTIGFAWLHILVLLVNLRLHSIHSGIHRTRGSLGHCFCWTRDTDAAGLTGVASHRQHRWLGILDFASLTNHRTIVC